MAATSQRIQFSDPDLRTSSQASELIARYPHLSDVEVARLIELYRKLSALDVALLISDEVLGPKLGQFFNDHRKQIRTPFGQYAMLVVTAAVGIAITVWAVVFGT